MNYGIYSDWDYENLSDLELQVLADFGTNSEVEAALEELRYRESLENSYY